ncbi:helix-turn-helix domain-containing protein [Paenibacillus sp. strain BS8-2]
MRLTISYDHSIPINAFCWTPSSTLKPLHYHNSLEIGLCIAGRGLFYYGEKKYAVQCGDVFIVNNLELHIAQADEIEPSTFIFINFDPRLLLAEDEALLLPFSYRSDHFNNHIPADSSLAPLLGALIHKMSAELEKRDASYQSMAKSTLLEICVLLLRHYASGIATPQWNKLTRSFSRMRPALEWMHTRFREPMELSDVAATLHVSPSQASRLFQQELGRGYKDILLELRVNEAKRLLLQSDINVTEVGLESGFQSVASFFRQFKHITGLSPLDYRQKYAIHAILESIPQELSREGSPPFI